MQPLKIYFRTLSDSNRGSEFPFSSTVSSRAGKIKSKCESSYDYKVFAKAANVARVAILTLMFLLLVCFNKLGTTLPIN